MYTMKGKKADWDHKKVIFSGFYITYIIWTQESGKCEKYIP